jgi:hypothetical protein
VSRPRATVEPIELVLAAFPRACGIGGGGGGGGGGRNGHPSRRTRANRFVASPDETHRKVVTRSPGTASTSAKKKKEKKRKKINKTKKKKKTRGARAPGRNSLKQDRSSEAGGKI